LNQYNKYLKQYQTNNVETASKEKLLIMLYDAAIQFLTKAKIAIEEKNGSEIYNNIIGCERILREFMRTIDLDNGVAVGPMLFSFYNNLIKILMKANSERSIEKVDTVLNHLIVLRDAFKEAIIIAKSEEAQREKEADKQKAIYNLSNNDEDEYEDGEYGSTYDVS